jgi:hypothetical protein
VKRLWPTVSLTLLLTSLAASAAADAQASASSPPPKPEVYFRAPANNATVSTTFPVLFGLRNYGVAPAGVNVSGTGHFHILIDVEPPPPGTLIPTDSLHRHFGGGQIETQLTLTPGPHTLRLVLADFEHKVISTDLMSAPIHITVRAGGGRSP